MVGALALAACVLSRPWAKAQAPLTWAQNTPGDSKPITLYADDITTWMEHGSRVFLLKGRVWVEHGVVRVQLPQGIAWLDEAQRKRTGIYHLDLITDGNVRLEEGANSFAGIKGRIEFNTRGEVHLKSYHGKVVQAAASSDPLYVQALAVKGTLVVEAPKTPTAVQPAVAKAPPARPLPLPPQAANLQTSSYELPPAAVPPPAPPIIPARAVLPPVPAAPDTAAPIRAQLGLPQ
jgi:hypothetical protein